MRDLLIFLLVFGALPWVLMRPYVGVLIYSWLSYMNPHRLTWGFAYDFPFAQIIAILTLVSLLFSKEKKRIPWCSTTVIWMLWVVWFSVTTVFALTPDAAVNEWERTVKIQLMILVTLLAITNRKRVDLLIWTIVISLGFFGVKGGIFTVLTGAQFRLYGPPGSFIAGNNELALALVMTLPLMRYLQLQAQDARLRVALMASIFFVGLAILATYSRGALVAGVAMVALLIWRSPYRIRFGVAVLAALPLLLVVMPDAWFDRMGTITEYRQDSSAMGRINSWWFAYNLAVDRPLLGGGFQVFQPEPFKLYAPDPDLVLDAHSIYFEVLAEHGFVGLGIFLLLGISALRAGTWIRKHAVNDPALSWAYNLAGMLQVSLLGYAVGGAFLGLAYYDLGYHLIAILIIVKVLLRREAKEAQVAADSVAQPVAPGAARSLVASREGGLRGD